MTKSIRKYYAGCIDIEWNRLVSSPYHKLELDTSLHFLGKHFPEKGLVLDAGGGPGRYTIELAQRGFDVVLLDMTLENLELAKRQVRKAKLEHRVKEMVGGSIVNMSRFANNTFDAVLCLGGPLSHVLKETKRDKAISELVRVAKKRAPIFVSVMSRLSLLKTTLTLFPDEVELPRFKKYRDTGDYAGRYGFTACHFFLPEELKEAFAKREDVEVLEMVGLEGIGSNFEEKINELAKNKKRWKVWLETHYKTCSHPSVVGTSEHILLVCRKG